MYMEHKNWADYIIDFSTIPYERKGDRIWLIVI